MKKTFKIYATMKKKIEDECLSATMTTRITWEVEANDMNEAQDIAKLYIRLAEKDEGELCNFMSIEEAYNVCE